MNKILFTCLIAIIVHSSLAQENEKPLVPVIVSEWWRICEMPDLDSLQGANPARQHVIDHGFIQADNGRWQLWACMRGTKPGRIFYGWEGESLEKGPWKPTGVKARADASYGEPTDPEKIQAPYFLKSDSAYLCFYNAAGIRIMTSKDGVRYQRHEIKDRNNILYEDGGRDVMVLATDSLMYAYSTVSTVARDGWAYGFVILRTSQNLKQWSDYTIVSRGGRAGNGPVSAESPFVVFKNEYFYLFRATSTDGRTYVYRSKDPYNFGVDNDDKLITILPVKAPELIEHNGEWYISDLADFKGIKLAKMKWQ